MAIVRGVVTRAASLQAVFHKRVFSEEKKHPVEGMNRGLQRNDR
jgi:hypothetical protein